MLKLDEVSLPLIAILRGIRPEEARAIGEVLLAGGIEIVEVTMNSPEPLKTLKVLVDVCGDRMLVGCGTVLTPDEVDGVADAGGGLVVSPNFARNVVARTKERGLLSAPGCLTATEIFGALDAGADMAKVFPGNIATPAVIKAYRAVLPADARIVVTGGVSADTIPSYKEAGVFGLGLGSNLYKAGKSPAEVAADLKDLTVAWIG